MNNRLDSVIDMDSQDDDQGLSEKQLIARMAEPNPLVQRDLDDGRIIHSRTPSESSFNAFRELRTDLLHRTGNENFVALVTSVVKGGGATHVAINLGSAIALDRSHTALIVDCNIYHPTAHSVLKIDKSPGLTDFLADPDGVRIEDIIRPTGIPRLRAIPVGSRAGQETENFGNLNMRLLIHMLQQRYPDRYIILDAPSMQSAADTRILADYADQIIAVVPYGRVTSSKVVDACRAFPVEKFAGVVLNRQPTLFGD
ncbi:MAG: polysaccharide biosynthesis protein [Lysobacterales bacterium]